MPSHPRACKVHIDGLARIKGAPLSLNDIQADPVGRARGATDGGLVQHDGLARPRAARPTGRRLRLRRARPSAIQRSCVTYSHNEPQLVSRRACAAAYPQSQAYLKK